MSYFICFNGSSAQLFPHDICNGVDDVILDCLLRVPLVPVTCFQVISQDIVNLCSQFQYSHEVASVAQRFCSVTSKRYISTTAQQNRIDNITSRTCLFLAESFCRYWSSKASNRVLEFMSVESNALVRTHASL